LGYQADLTKQGVLSALEHTPRLQMAAAEKIIDGLEYPTGKGRLAERLGV